MPQPGQFPGSLFSGVLLVFSFSVLGPGNSFLSVQLVVVCTVIPNKIALSNAFGRSIFLNFKILHLVMVLIHGQFIMSDRLVFY